MAKHSTNQADRIVSEALTLPSDERTRIAVTLLESVDGPPDPHAHLSHAELVDELASRARSVLDGTADTVSAEDVHARLEKGIARYT